MAGVWADSFDWYSTAQMARAYSSVNTPGAGTIAVGAFGRDGDPGVRMTNDRQNDIRRVGMTWISGNVVIADFDIRISAYPSVSNIILIALDGDGSDPDNQAQVSLHVETTGAFRVKRGFDTTATNLTPASSYVLPLDTTVRVSFKAVIDNAAGTIHLDVYQSDNDTPTPLFAFTGLDTRNTAASQWNGFILGAVSDTGTTDFSHFTMCDGSGAEHNDRLGPCDVRSKHPISDGAYTEFDTASGTGGNYEMVDDTTADDDTSYTEGVDGETDTFGVADVETTDEVLFSAWVMQTRTEFGTPTIAPVARESTTDTVGSAQTVPSAYTTTVTPTFYQKTPSGAAWTPTNWNAMEWGYEAGT